MELAPLGRVLIAAGLALAFVGLLLVLGERIPLVGRLPGDVVVRGDRWTFYAPLATSLLVSVVLTAALSLIAWLAKR